MSGRRRKPTLTAALVAALALAGCTGGGEQAAQGTDAPTTTPTTTEAVNELERNQKVDEFLDAVEFNTNCMNPECLTAQATYSRYQNLYELADEIPGDDILSYFIVISSAWDAWNDCLSTADSRFERFDCAEESDMEQAITDLYNALR